MVSLFLFCSLVNGEKWKVDNWCDEKKKTRQVCIIMKWEEKKKLMPFSSHSRRRITLSCVCVVAVVSCTAAMNMNTKSREAERERKKRDKRKADTVNKGVSYHIYNVNVSDTVCYYNSQSTWLLYTWSICSQYFPVHFVWICLPLNVSNVQWVKYCIIRMRSKQSSSFFKVHHAYR